MENESRTSDPKCAHGRLAYERCRECEDSYHAGSGNGFDRPTPPGWCPICGGQDGEHKSGCEDGSVIL